MQGIIMQNIRIKSGCATRMRKWNHSTCHCLSQSAVSRRLNSSPEANSSCCHKSDARSYLGYSIISIDSDITDSIIRKIISIQQETCRSRIELWGTPALAGYSWKGFSHPLPPKTYYRQNKAKSTTWNSLRFEFVRKTSMSHPVKSHGYIKCHSSGSPRAIKIALGTVSEITVRRSAVARENLKTYWKSEKRPQFSSGSTNLLFTSFSKILQTTEKRLTGR